MYAADNPVIGELWNASVRDINTLAFGIDDEVFGFHAQQAVEKLYKVLIVAHGVEHKFTHRLMVLHDQLVTLGEELPAVPIDLDELSEFAVEFRYESGRPFSAEQRDAMRSAIERLKSFVLSRRELLRQAETLMQVS